MIKTGIYFKRLPCCRGSLILISFVFVSLINVSVSCKKATPFTPQYNGTYYCYYSIDSANDYKILTLDNNNYLFQKINQQQMVMADKGSMIFTDTILTITTQEIYYPQSNNWIPVTSPVMYSYSIYYNTDTLIILPNFTFNDQKTGTYFKK